MGGGLLGIHFSYSEKYITLLILYNEKSGFPLS